MVRNETNMCSYPIKKSLAADFRGMDINIKLKKSLNDNHRNERIIILFGIRFKIYNSSKTGVDYYNPQY